MEPKAVIRPRVIVEYVVDKDTDQRRTYYAAGYIEGYGGSDLIIEMPNGRHIFSRRDGTWLSGDCLNFVDGKIMNFNKVEAAVQAGYCGDVEMHQKSLPMTAAS